MLVSTCDRHYIITGPGRERSIGTVSMHRSKTHTRPGHRCTVTGPRAGLSRSGRVAQGRRTPSHRPARRMPGVPVLDLALNFDPHAERTGTLPECPVIRAEPIDGMIRHGLFMVGSSAGHGQWVTRVSRSDRLDRRHIRPVRRI